MKGESFDEMIERYKRDMMNISPKALGERAEKPAAEEEEKEEETPRLPNTQTGFLKVRVVTDRGKTVQGAAVLVTDREDENPVFRFFGFTGENGESAVIPLPAPPGRILSRLRGGNLTLPMM